MYPDLIHFRGHIINSYLLVIAIDAPQDFSAYQVGLVLTFCTYTVLDLEVLHALPILAAHYLSLLYGLLCKYLSWLDCLLLYCHLF